ncbi:MAG: cyclic nucleotide-binding domain-containing protein [Magnetococcales bacterium]|nr:cyclic nucleotide-binding domain-containing protein [Magnetococcales bacterium]
MQPEITIDDLAIFIRNVQGFDTLSAKEVGSLIAPIISIVMYAPGQAIINHGDIGRSIFFLYQGVVRADIHINKLKTEHYDMQKGEIFGDLALVTNAKRSADVIAVTEACCLVIDIETFQELMKNNWKITQSIASLVGRRRIEQRPGY